MKRESEKYSVYASGNAFLITDRKTEGKLRGDQRVPSGAGPGSS